MGKKWQEFIEISSVWFCEPRTPEYENSNMSYISVDFPQIQNKGAGMLKNYSVILYPVFIPIKHTETCVKKEK